MMRVVLPLFLVSVLVSCAPMSGTGVSKDDNSKDASELGHPASTVSRPAAYGLHHGVSPGLCHFGVGRHSNLPVGVQCLRRYCG